MIENFQPLTYFPLLIYVGMDIEQPSPYEIKSKYLEMEYKGMKAYVNIQREKWETWMHNYVRWMDQANQIEHN